MLLTKGLSGSTVCEKIGCSPASLQNWKKAYNDGTADFSLDDLKENKKKKAEEEEWDEKPHTPPLKTTPSSSRPSKSAVSREEFVKQYWRRKTVDTVMEMPETIDEVVKLINNALSYAYDHLVD